MLLRNRLPMVVALACAAGCVTTQPFTQSVRTAGYGPAELAAAPFLTDGEFELWTATLPIGVSPRTPGRFVEAPDDTTIVVAVQATEQLELKLTFGRTRGHADAYTLRAVNGQPLDKTITIEGIGYEYRACYLNVGWKCQNPVQPGTHNDTGVTLLVRLPRKPPSPPAS